MCWALTIISVCLLPTILAAQDEDEDSPDLRAGLVAEFIGADGRSLTRIDPTLDLMGRDATPDPRLTPGTFSAVWRGRLFTIASGEYRLRLFAAGKVQLKLAGKTLLDAEAEQPDWLDAEPIELTYGYHSIEIAYQKTGPEARLSLFWSGPQFSLEPVAARHLFHDPHRAPGEEFGRGERLVHALRCTGCHEMAGPAAALPAPALTNLAGNVSPDWLIDWIGNPTHPVHEQQGQALVGTEVERVVPSRMPDFALTRDEATLIAAFLMQPSPVAVRDVAPVAESHERNKNESPKRLAKKNSPNDKEEDVPPEVAGRKLFFTLGCLACHRVGSLGGGGLFGGGDLSHVAAKRPADFFDRWLAEPARSNSSHRMPVFRLSADERLQLAAYLNTQGKRQSEATPQAEQTSKQPIESNETDPKPRASDNRPLKAADRIARGRDLAKAYRCGACHKLPGDADPTRPAIHVDTSAKANWNASCLAAPDRRRERPGYHLRPQQAAAVRSYLSALPPGTIGSANVADAGRLVLAERNCLACHARGLTEGIAPTAAAATRMDERLAPLLPAMTPPALTGVGDKLHDAALRAAVATTNGPLRRWLAVRMPRFDLSDSEMKALTTSLVDHDRIPEVAAREPTALDTAELRLAGGRLVTSAGFGCTSCHQIGNAIPRNVALAARGTDLSLLGGRIRRSWYDRWVRDPARIVPRMEMPAIKMPVRGVLDDDVDTQLAAVWHSLNTPGFNPPRPDPVRVVRTRNLRSRSEPARVLTDVFESNGQTYVKPLVIGLPNRHNVLFDLEHNRLALWWLGDTALQRTRGKSWYWEPGGSQLFGVEPSGSELLLMCGSTHVAPMVAGQFPTEFEWFEHVRGGVRFRQRLMFSGDTGAEDPLQINITQTFTAIASRDGKNTSGVRRRIEIIGLPPEVQVLFRVAPVSADDQNLKLTEAGRAVQYKGKVGPATVRLIHPESSRLHLADGGPSLRMSSESDAVPSICELDYLTSLSVDRFPVPLPAPPTLAPVTLNVVPGFDAVRLPLPGEFMPTALGWRADGTLIVGSLKGRIWLGHDTDGDELEDRLTVFSDELAAPYGVAAHGEAIDVLNKYALLRLYDRDRDRRAERTETVASGWGHTIDYHDWAVGLPRDRDGNYYVALPCQQDDRDPADAHLRGAAFKLVPRRPTDDDSRRYSIEIICTGLRFPMGIARSRSGDLFTTDNQGNYNPFNELNHLQSGARYGFINKLDRETNIGGDRGAEFQPPAIEIPHPWTRSVNGIAFLYTPPAVRESLGHDLFGPLEGHLVGCEYDTGRLIRMSLERIGGTYQGAAYPMSIVPAKGQPTFLGPLVCAVSPQGDLYVGNIRDSGWGGGANIGSIVRLRPTGTWPLGIAEVRAHSTGLTIDFTGPVDKTAAVEKSNYQVSCFRRVSTPAYGGPDVDRQRVAIERLTLSVDARSVELEAVPMKAGYVYEIRLGPLAPGGGSLQPSEAYYTMRQIPE